MARLGKETTRKHVMFKRLSRLDEWKECAGETAELMRGSLRKCHHVQMCPRKENPRTGR